MNPGFEPTRKLELGDPVEFFDCGQADLNRYLERYAWISQKANSAQTYISCAGMRIAGYYSLSVGGVDYFQSPARLTKGLARHPVPVMILARLAVDRSFQGRGLGLALLKDSFLRTLKAADIAGIRAMLVHPKDATARAFYERFGFEASPFTPNHLFLLIKDIQGTL